MRTILEIIAAGFALAGPVLVLVNYSYLPAQIPMHFNWRGVPDRWGSRATVWLLPVLGVTIYLSWTWISVIASEAPRQPPPGFYVLLTLVKLEMLALFLSIERGMIRVALGQRERLDWSVLAITVLLLGTAACLSLFGH